MKGVSGMASTTAVAQSSRAVPESSERAAKPVCSIVNHNTNCGSIAVIPDEISREVYCILGIPIDAIEMPAVLHRIETAAASRMLLFISAPNLNYLVNSQQDSDFRESLLLSNLCPADGMPILWIARLMGLPIKHRIAGSDIFEALKVLPRAERPLKVFFFGSTEAVAAAAARRLNTTPSALTCVGWICPGFEAVDKLSEDHFIDEINSSEADFLVAALGGKKGQFWLQQNHRRLRIPIRAHLGATINFQAGAVKRSPYILQKLGLEWLWRIKEEPYLWRRYWRDGIVLLRLMLTQVLPLAVRERSFRRRCERFAHDLFIEQVEDIDSVTLALRGFAIAGHAGKAISCFRDALAAKKQIVVDFSQTHKVDARFLGLLLMVRKQLKTQDLELNLVGVSLQLQRMFRLYGAEYLLCGSEDS